jgi:hypothetical protein
MEAVSCVCRRDKCARTVLALAIAASGGCAHHIGKKAGEGAIEALKKNPPSEQPMRVAAGRAVEGAMDTLEDPAQQERLRAIIDRAVDAAVARSFQALADPRQQERLRALVTEMVDEASSRGFENVMSAEPGQQSKAAALASQIASAAAHEVMREVAQGMNTGFDQLFPGCDGLDEQACRHRRLRALSSEAGAGFAVGLLGVMRWPLLIATGLLGLVTGLLGHWLWTLRGRPAAGSPGPRPAPSPSRAATQS